MAQDLKDTLQLPKTDFPMRGDLAPHAALPDDTRLWARLQDVSGGTWGGGVYDPDRIAETLRAGQAALAAQAGRRPVA